MFKTFYSTSDGRNDPFLLYPWLFWIQSNFQVTKKQQEQRHQKQIKGHGSNVCTSCISFSLGQNSNRTTQTNTVNKQKIPPWACDKGCAEACAERFFALKSQADQSWPTLTSRSLQSIARPFQKRFREVFGNARILNFYLSIKAWEEKSLPKSHLGWFFLVFGEGKATKENISIFWFIWPLSINFTFSL